MPGNSFWSLFHPPAFFKVMVQPLPAFLRHFPVEAAENFGDGCSFGSIAAALSDVDVFCQFSFCEAPQEFVTHVGSFQAVANASPVGFRAAFSRLCRMVKISTIFVEMAVAQTCIPSFAALPCTGLATWLTAWRLQDVDCPPNVLGSGRVLNGGNILAGAVNGLSVILIPALVPSSALQVEEVRSHDLRRIVKIILVDVYHPLGQLG
jgi:hypothetical protein